MKLIFQNNSSRPPLLRFLVKVIVVALTIFIAELFLPGFSINDPFTAIIAAVIIALLNMFLRPVLIVLTLPFTIFSLGFFLLIINAFIIYLTGKIVPGFEIESFWPAFWLGLLITVFGYLLELPEKMINRRKQEEDDDMNYRRRGEGFTDYEDITDEGKDSNPPELRQ